MRLDYRPLCRRQRVRLAKDVSVDLFDLPDVVAAALAGMAITTLYNFVLSDGLAMMGAGAAAFTAVIWAIALFLFFYSRAMSQRGVLR